MITRILDPREEYLADFINVVAFEGKCDLEKMKEEAAAMTDEQAEKIVHPLPEHDDPLPHEKVRRSTPWASFDGDRAISAMYVGAYTVRFGGEQMLMGGIGGVASLPDARRMGGVREMMRASFRDMADNGYAFAELYPFSTDYYRQFGFEKGIKVDIWTLPMEYIRANETGGRIRQLLPGDSTAPLTEIYNRFYADWNLSCVRRDFNAKMDLQKMLNEQRYVFVWEDELGVPKGFMITKKVQAEGQPVLDCTTNFGLNNAMIFLDARAFRALLTFAKKAFASDYRAIRFQTPSCLHMDTLVGEGTVCRHSGKWNGMVRVISVGKVLGACRCRGEGSIVLNIVDKMLPDNDGGWRITYAPGKANQVERTDDAPDITLTIGDFSTLICGITSSADLPWLPDAQVHDPSVPYEQIFYPQKCFTMDLF